jgi:hypothetical protein
VHAAYQISSSKALSMAAVGVLVAPCQRAIERAGGGPVLGPAPDIRLRCLLADLECAADEFDERRTGQGAFCFFRVFAGCFFAF